MSSEVTGCRRSLLDDATPGAPMASQAVPPSAGLAPARREGSAEKSGAPNSPLTPTGLMTMFVCFSDGTRIARTGIPEYPVVTLPCPRCNAPVEQYDSPGRRGMVCSLPCDDCAWLPSDYGGPALDTVPTEQLIHLFESYGGARSWSTALDGFLDAIREILIERDSRRVTV